MTISQFFSILRARWRVAAMVFFGVLAVVLVLSLVLPKKYKADASVVVDVKPDPVTQVYGAMLNPAIMATQVDIITSDRVSRRVIKNLKLDQDPSVRAQWQEDTEGQGTIEDWLGGVFQKNLDVKPSRESNVITVSYTARDPKFAATLANAFVQAYLDTALELRVDPAKKYTGFFDAQLKETRDALTTAQNKLSAVQRESGVVGTDDRFDVEVARLNDIGAQLSAAQAVAADSTGRQSQATSGNGDRLTETLSNPVIANLKVDLGRAEANLEELNSRLGPNHPQVLQAKANIAELKSRIDSETKRVTGGVTVTAKINKSRVHQIQSELDAQRARVLRLKEAHDRIALLQRDVENAQRAYDAVALRYSQTSLESQTQQSNVSVLSPASPPIDPSFPKLLLNMLVAVFLGVLLAVAAAVVGELRDRRVRASSDLVSALGLPMLGVMPKPRKKRQTAPTQMAQRVLFGRLPAPTKK